MVEMTDNVINLYNAERDWPSTRAGGGHDGLGSAVSPTRVEASSVTAAGALERQHLQTRLVTARSELARVQSAGPDRGVRPCVLAARALLPTGDARQAMVPAALREWLRIWLLGGQPGSVRRIADSVFRLARLLTLVTGEAPPSHPALAFPMSVHREHGLCRESGERELEAWLVHHAAVIYRFLGELEEVYGGFAPWDDPQPAWRPVLVVWYRRRIEALEELGGATLLH